MDKKIDCYYMHHNLLVDGLIAFYSLTNQEDEIKVCAATVQMPDEYHVED